jgi:hypothetical protein
MLLPSLAASFHGAECELKLEQDWSVPFQSCLGAWQTQAKAAEDVSTRRVHKRVFKQSFCLLGLPSGNEKASGYHQQDCRQEDEEDDQKAQ